jgi:hypothetical protein
MIDTVIRTYIYRLQACFYNPRRIVEPLNPNGYIPVMNCSVSFERVVEENIVIGEIGSAGDIGFIVP